MQNKNQFLTKTKLHEVAPSIYADSPSPDVSNNYVYVPSHKIISELGKEGWKPVRASQSSSRDGEYNGVQKHSIWFQPESYNRPDKLKVGEIVPQIYWGNSHDRSFRCRMNISLDRCVCSNQLVTPFQVFESINQIHMGIDFQVLRKHVREVVKKFNIVYEKVSEYTAIKLSKRERVKFAKKAHQLRWTDGSLVNPETLLNPRREEDEDIQNTLWGTFNIVQENLIKGGTEYKGTKGIVRHTRQVDEVRREMKINQELWLVMEAIRTTKIG